MLRVLIHYATNPDTPFVVTEMTFLDLRDKTKDEEVMSVHLQKRFLVKFLDGKHKVLRMNQEGLVISQGGWVGFAVG